MTELCRFNMSTTPNLHDAIRDECDRKAANGFHLATSFVYQTTLVLIFQKL